MELENIVPTLLQRRIESLVKTKNVWEALERLSEAGYCELVSLLASYLAAAGESNTSFTPYPLSDRIIECKCKQQTDTFYIIIKVLRENQEDFICVAIDDFKSDEEYAVRPCTMSEYESTIEKRFQEEENQSKIMPSIILKATKT